MAADAPTSKADARRDYISSVSRWFERVAGWSFDHRWLVLAGCLLLLAACAALSSRTRFDNSFAAYFDHDDPAYVAYDVFRDDFGSEEVSYILYAAPASEHGPFDLEVMGKIKSLTETLEREVPFVKEVTSLANVEYLEGIPGGLKVYDLLEELPADQNGLLEIRDKVLAKPLYVGGLVSRDGHYAAIIIDMERSSVDPIDQITLDPDAGEGLDNLYPQVTYHRIEEILVRPEYAGIEFHHVGDVPLNAIYNEIVANESGTLGAITFAVIGALLFVFFRSFTGVIGPLAVVCLSIMAALAWAGLLGWRLDLMFIMLPTLLIAVGVADAVHVIAEFRAYHVELGDRREAARRTLYLVGTPCLLTSLTTAAGFASMSVSPIKAISHFAIYSAVGVLAAFSLTVTLLLVLLSFGRRRVPHEASAEEKIRAKGGRLFANALTAVAHFDVRHRKAIIATSVVVFSLAGLGIARLRVDSNFLHEFSPDEPIRQATERVDEIMGGSYSYIFLFDGGGPEGVKNPEVMQEIDRLQQTANAYPDLVRKSYSIGDLMKDINKSFHAEDPAYYALPETRDLTGQYLLIYEMAGGGELDDYLSGDFERASLELRLKVIETSVLELLIDDLNASLEEHPLQASTVIGTGIGALWLRLQQYITQSQIRGFLLAFTVIAILLCMIFKSVKLGLIAMVPNLTPVVLALGALGWLGMPLDYVRLLIASVAIGISVDDTIHHVTRFRHEFQRRRSYARALEAATLDVGRALFITSVVLVMGFLVFLGSGLDSTASFGWLLAGTVVAAFLADIFLMPALVLTFEPFGPEADAAGQ